MWCYFFKSLFQGRMNYISGDRGTPPHYKWVDAGTAVTLSFADEVAKFLYTPTLPLVHPCLQTCKYSGMHAVPSSTYVLCFQ